MKNSLAYLFYYEGNPMKKKSVADQLKNVVDGEEELTEEEIALLAVDGEELVPGEEELVPGEELPVDGEEEEELAPVEELPVDDEEELVPGEEAQEQPLDIEKEAVEGSPLMAAVAKQNANSLNPNPEFTNQQRLLNGDEFAPGEMEAQETIIMEKKKAQLRAQKMQRIGKLLRQVDEELHNV